MRWFSPEEYDNPVNLPSLHELREAVGNFAKRRIPGRAKLRQDAIAGLTVGISSVPYGMAGTVLDVLFSEVFPPPEFL